MLRCTYKGEIRRLWLFKKRKENSSKLETQRPSGVASLRKKHKVTAKVPGAV